MGKNKSMLCEYMITIGLFCITAVVIIPIIVSARYSFFYTDDFYHANSVGIFGESVWKLLIESIRYDKKMYLTWQGTYTSMFLQAFLSPLNGYGSFQLAVVMVLNAVLFMVALGMFATAVCKSFSIQPIYIYIIFLICVWGIFGFTVWSEVIWWFSGAVSYVFPLSFGFLGISIVLRKQDRSWYIIAAVLIFMAQGGTLEVAGIVCFVLMGICIIKRMANMETVKDYFVFGVAVMGALVNAIAPGNYVRHAVIDETGLHVGKAIFRTCSEVICTIEELLTDTPFLLVVIISLIVGTKVWNSIKLENKKIIYVLGAVGFIAPFVTCFPVCLAYSGEVFFPNRCKFVETVVVVISVVLIAVIIGVLLGSELNFLRRKETYLGLVMFLIIMFNINPSWKISQSVSFHMWEQLAEGNYKESYDKVNTLYEFISTDTDENVFIYEKPDEVEGFLTNILSEDMSDPMNMAVAKYYGKKTVQYVTEPLYEQSNGQKNIRISSKMFARESEELYVSVFKIDGTTEETEPIEILQPLDVNRVISIPQNESGKIAIYLFADREDAIPIDEIVVEY